MALGKKLKELRKQHGLSQQQLSEKLLVSRQAVSGWEAGSSRPSTENLHGLSKLYGVPLEYLLDDDVPEMVCAGQAADSKKVEEKDTVKGKKHIVLMLIAVGILIVVLCAMIFLDEEREPIPIGNMEGSVMETGEDFELEW